MKYIVLNNGVSMPSVGLGTYPMNGRELTLTTIRAVRAGYTSFDTSAAYGNEYALGWGLKLCGKKREKLFITSKISNKHIRLHDLRHSFCQIGYDLDIDLSTRSKLLGHSNIKTTNNIYTDYSAKKTASAVEQINNEISKYIKNASTD